MAFGSLQGIVGRAGGNEVIGRGIIDVGVSSYRVRHDMRTITGAIGKEAQLWGKAFRLAAVGIGAVAVAGAAVLVGSIATAEKFNAAMARVAAMTGVTTTQFAAMRRGVLAMSGSVKQGPEELAKGLYFIASAGFRGVEALQLLDKAAKASAASGADLEVVADALVSIMNAYGLTAKDAGYASDILTKTVAYGKVEFQDLAKAIGPVSTISRVAGISLEEMGAALAMLTTRGLSARRATNTLWSTLRALTKPTEQQWKMIKALGLDFKPEDVKTNGLIKTLEKFDRAAQAWQLKNKGQKLNLTKVYDPSGKVNLAKSQKQFEKMNRGYFDIMSKMVGQSNAFLVSQILLQKTGETFDFYVKRMKGFGDGTEEAYKKARKYDLAIVFGETTSKIQGALISLGDKLLPAVRSVVEWIGKNGPIAVKWFSDVLFDRLIPAAQKAAASVSKLVSAVLGIFDTGKGSSKSPIESMLGVVINLFEHTLDLVSRLSDVITSALGNSTVKSIASVAVALGGILLVMSAIRTAGAGIFGKIGGLGGKMVYGATGKKGASTVGAAGAAAATVNTGGAALKLAADELVLKGAVPLNLAAKELIAAAFQLGKAAKFMLPAGERTRGPDGRFVRAPGNPQGGVPGAPVIIPSGGGGPKPKPPVPGAGKVGSGLVASAAKGLTNGMMSGLKGIGWMLSSGMKLVSGAILPLLIVDMVGSMLKEPLGDILGGIKIGNFDFKAAGEAMKEDFWGGLIVAAQTILSGGAPIDAYKGLSEKTVVGNVSVDTMLWKNLGVSALNVKNLQAAGTAVGEDGKPKPVEVWQMEQRVAVDQSAERTAEAVRMQNLLRAKLLAGNFGGTSGRTDSPEMQGWMSIIKAIESAGVDTSGAARRSDVQLPGYHPGPKFDTGFGWSTKPERNMGENIEIVDPIALMAKVKQMGIRVEEINAETLRVYRKTMTDQLLVAGNKTFSQTDLAYISRSGLETLTAAAQKDTEGLYGNLRAYMTNQYINAGKGNVNGSKDYGKLATAGETLDVALKRNIAPLSESLTFLLEDLAKLKTANEEIFVGGQSYIKQWGERMEDAGGSVRKWAGVVNDAFSDKLGGKKYTYKQTAGTKTTTTKDDVYQYFFGGKKITQAAFDEAVAGMWEQMQTTLAEAQGASGWAASQALASGVAQVVEKGLSEGMSLDTIKAGMPADLWQRFIDSVPGGEQATEVLGTRLQGIINGAFKKGSDPKKIPKSTRTALLAEFNNMFKGDKTLVWKDILPMILKPAELRKWIADNLKPLVPVAPIPKTDPREDGRGIKPPSNPVPTKPLALDLSPEVTKSWQDGGTQATGEFNKGVALGIPALTEGVRYALDTSVSQQLVGHSPPPMGPLSGDALPGAGRNIMMLVGSGAAGASGILGIMIAGSIARATKKGSLASTVALLAGLNLGNQIAKGMTMAITSPIWALKIAAAISPFLPLNSPAKKGPFAGAAWRAPFTAGQNLAGQMTKGLTSKPLTLPGLEAGASHGMKVAGSKQSGHTQTINVDRLSINSQADEASILTRLQFLQPMGR